MNLALPFIFGYSVLLALFYGSKRWKEFDSADKILLAGLLGFLTNVLIPLSENEIVFLSGIVILVRISIELLIKLVLWAFPEKSTTLKAKIASNPIFDIVIGLWGR